MSADKDFSSKSIERAGLYRSIIRENRPIAKIRDKLMNHTLHYGDLLPSSSLRRLSRAEA